MALGERRTANLLGRQSRVAASLLERRERVEHFLARGLLLAIAVRVLEFLDRLLQRPLLRQCECRLGHEVAAREPGVWLCKLRSDHVHEVLMGHAAVRRRADPELLAENLFDRGLASDDLDPKDRMLLL